MRAAVMEGIRKPLVVRDMPDPSPAPNGAVVRVEANGICRTDWHLWTGDWSMSAIRCCNAWKTAIGFPNAWRVRV